jgi:ubiquinone/menaquinone biosynthesis C-methylase UbiE
MDAIAFKESVRRHFDERADRYDDDTQRCDTEDFENFRTVIPYLLAKSGTRVLEVATGSGIVLEMLLNAGKDACGVDFSRGLLEVARVKRNIVAQRLNYEDAERMSFADGSFDSTCIFRSLHHMEDQEAVLHEMTRCASRSVFVYDSAGGWRRLAKRALQRLRVYDSAYRLARGHKDTGYRPANETEGPVKVFYAEDAIRVLRKRGLRIRRTLKLGGSLFIHAEKQ